MAQEKFENVIHRVEPAAVTTKSNRVKSKANAKFFLR